MFSMSGLNVILSFLRTMHAKKKWSTQGDLQIRRIFLVPTATGWSFLIATLIILSLSINFSAVAGYLLGFIVASLLIVAMPLGLRNIVKLHFSIVDVGSAFVGEHLTIKFAVKNPSKRIRYSVHVEYEKKRVKKIVDIDKQSKEIIDLPFITEIRGDVEVPALRISTTFPLGLMKVSAFWRPNFKALVYCRPELGGPSFEQAHAANIGGDSKMDAEGSDDFSGIRDYVAGDRPRNLAWRQIARFGGMESGKFYTKVFETEQGRYKTITDHHLDALISIEEKLSRVSAWVIKAEEEGVCYALDCMGIKTIKSKGESHYHLCLAALAQVEKGVKVEH